MLERRDPVLFVASLVTIAISLIVLTESFAWIGKPFPGFLLLENKVVASAGLSHWPATDGGRIYQHEVITMDGLLVTDAASLHRYVNSISPETPIKYEFKSGSKTFDQIVSTRLFDRFDYTLLFGSLLLNGLALCGTALMIRYLRGDDRLAAGSFPILFIAGLWSITAIDLYGPYRLFRIHALCETFLFAGATHMALVFPHPSKLIQKHPRILWALYGSAACLAATNQIGLYHPALYRSTHLLATSAFGASLVFFIASTIRWFVRPPSFEARQRVKILVLGTAASLTLPVGLTLGSTLTGGETPQNAMTFTGIFYPLSIGYAILRHNLLEVDVFVRRTFSYVMLTAIATLSYVTFAQSLDFLLEGSVLSNNRVLGYALTVLFLILLLPLRDRVQSGIDRIFFRTAYDFRRIVEDASEKLASVAELSVIANELSNTIHATLHPDGFILFVNRNDTGVFTPFPENTNIPSPGNDIVQKLRVSEGLLDAEDGGLLLPFRAGGTLVAILALGRPLSGRIYGSDDRRLLQTLAHQGAVAIENAIALEQLRDLNRDLEAKVEERTEELREAHAHLVHREKMASLGQFVAGIAHEINNPLNFIQGNLHILREYVTILRNTLNRYEATTESLNDEMHNRMTEIRKDADLDEILKDIDSAFDGCTEGVERSTTLVNDLRTFSRLDQPDRMPADLQAAIESTLNLLRSKLTGIEVVKEFEDIPMVECLSGQINQVFLNLIANAADEMERGGTLTIRTFRVGDDRVAFEIQDTGNGIDAENLDKIFDPFFTTKEVGKGTGLGLAISYGVVSRHGGTLEVDSEPGRGTCFRFELPLKSSSPGETDRGELPKAGE